MGDVIKLGGGSYSALEFFSGIGCARAGMAKAGIRTIWANDIDKTKCELYQAQWGGDDLLCRDVFDVDPDVVPEADIAWASSPCTDLSLAGKREGLIDGPESSAFFGFVQVIEGLGARRPRVLVLENVSGLASSHDGDDFRTVVSEFNRLGYSVDAFELDARRWVPQSRPRMFVVGLEMPGEELQQRGLPLAVASGDARAHAALYIQRDPVQNGVSSKCKRNVVQGKKVTCHWPQACGRGGSLWR